MAARTAHPNQFAFTFTAPAIPGAPAELAGFEARICRAAGQMLKEDVRDRAVIAAEMSTLLDEEVTTHMLNAYASPARPDHKVIMSRFLALVAVTKRHDILDQIVRQIGASVLVGEEVITAQIGQIDRDMERLREKRKRLVQIAPHIGEGRNG